MSTCPQASRRTSSETPRHRPSTRCAREAVAASAEPPTRGQLLAIYDAVTSWVAYVEREWKDLAPGEAMSGTATDTLNPILLDAWGERFVDVSHQHETWLNGEAKSIPERAASEA